MSEARALTNFAGNAVATVLVGHWVGEFDKDQARQVLRRRGPVRRGRLRRRRHPRRRRTRRPVERARRRQLRPTPSHLPTPPSAARRAHQTGWARWQWHRQSASRSSCSTTGARSSRYVELTLMYVVPNSSRRRCSSSAICCGVPRSIISESLASSSSGSTPGRPLGPRRQLAGPGREQVHRQLDVVRPRSGQLPQVLDQLSDLRPRRHRVLGQRHDVGPGRGQCERPRSAGGQHDRRTTVAVELLQVVQGLPDLVAPLLGRIRTAARARPPAARRPGRPVPMPNSNRPSVSTVSVCASQAAARGVRSGAAATKVPTRMSASAAAIARDGNGDGSCSPSGISTVEYPRSAARRTVVIHSSRSPGCPPHRTGIACRSSPCSLRGFGTSSAGRDRVLSTSHSGRRSPYAARRTLVTCH